MSFVPQTSYLVAQLNRRMEEGLRLHQAGQLSEAEDHYRFVLAKQPRHADALHYLGLIAYQAQQFDTAIDLIGRSVAVRGDNSAAHSNLGNALAMSGRLEEAELAFRNALQLKPEFADANFNLGNILHQQKKLTGAEEAYRRAIALNPNHFGALNNLANVLNLLGSPQEAAGAYAYLGNLLQDLGRSQDAGQAYERSLAILPNPGIEAQWTFLIPAIPASVAEIDTGRGHLFNGVAAIKAASIKLSEPLRYPSSAIFYASYHGRNDRELRQTFADFYLEACPDLAYSARHCLNYAGPREKIRVGFVSGPGAAQDSGTSDFAAIMGRLDHTRFALSRFCFGTPMAGADTGLHWLGDDLTTARKVIAAVQPDVLIYSEIGLDPAPCFLAYSRLAPVQCVTLAHPVTSGIPNMDYFLSAETLEPADAADHYSEILIRLARLPVSVEPATLVGKAPRRADFGVPADARLYVCGQSPLRIHPGFDASLAEILRRDPKAWLVLFNDRKTEHWGPQVLQRFRQSMPEVLERILLLPHLEHAAFLGFLQNADAVLDTPYFSGGTTSAEALALAIPVVTLPGTYARSRRTCAMYRQMNVLDLVAENDVQYIELALRLAQDPVWHKSLKARLQQQHAALLENDGAVAELEGFLEAAVAAAAKGQKYRQ